MSWLQFTPVASAIFSLCAAAVSAIAARRSSYNADRQFASSYFQDVSGWAARVLAALRDAVQLFDNRISLIDRQSRAAALGNVLIELLDLAALTFASPSADAIAALEGMISQVRADHQSLMTATPLSNLSADAYVELRTSFITSVRDELGVAKRRSDIERYLLA